MGNLTISFPKFLNIPISRLVFEDKKINIDYENFKFSPIGGIRFSNLKIRLPNNFKIDCRRVELKINYTQLVKRSSTIIDSLLLEGIRIESQKIAEEDIFIHKLQTHASEKEFHNIELLGTILRKEIKSKGLVKIPTRLRDTELSNFNLSKFVEEIDIIFENKASYVSQTSSQNVNVKFAYNSSSKLFLQINPINKISDKEKFYLNDFNIDISLDPKTRKLVGIAALGSLTGKTHSQEISFQNITAKISATKDSTDNKVVYSLIKTESSKFDGKLNGSLEPFNLIYESDSNNTTIHLLTSNETIESSLNLGLHNKNKQFSGFAKIKPDNLFLDFLRSDEYLKIASGDYLKIRFTQNLASTSSNFGTLFSVSARNFSALETPPGNYDFIGEIENNLNIEIRKAFGIMGKSEVCGSYSQSWNPHAYEFRVRGQCYPPDIKNWLGTWWGNIWKDFSFPAEIPYGDFRITGIWGGMVGNSRTFGFVDSSELRYKDFKLNESNVVVTVDDNFCKIQSKDLIHDHGELSGNLTFPRKHINSSVFLAFNLDGQYPLNEGRTIFGETFEKAVADINATSFLCNASGEFLNDPLGNSDSNFKLNLQSTTPFTVKGFKISDLHGSVEKKANITTCSFPSLKIANGKAQLNFDLDTNGTEDAVKLNFSLKEANKKLLIKDIIQSKKDGYIDKFSNNKKTIVLKEDSISDEGIVSIAIQAEGPMDNILQFEGTGMIHFKEPKIGQINLFGKISESLSNLKIPLPSGAFSFNELYIPFELNNESINFDDLRLTGPLSKMTAEGQFNLSSGTIDLIARLSLVGNISVPIVKNLLQFADPLSKIAEIKITGNFQNPKWELLLSSN